MKSEGALHLDFLGDDRVLRDRDIATKAELHECRARSQDFEPGPNSLLATRRFELDVEIAFVGSVGLKLRSIGHDVDDAVGADLEGFLQRRISEVSRNNLA